MARIFRAMTVDNGRPMVGPSPRALGVRVPDDIAFDKDEMVRPATGGMSVAPTWRQLPSHRIPRRLRLNGAPDARGKDEDACWRMGDGAFVSGALIGQSRLAVDRPSHGVVEPFAVMTHTMCVQELVGTQSIWVVDEA